MDEPGLAVGRGRLTLRLTLHPPASSGDRAPAPSVYPPSSLLPFPLCPQPYSGDTEINVSSNLWNWPTGWKERFNKTSRKAAVGGKLSRLMLQCHGVETPRGFVGHHPAEYMTPGHRLTETHAVFTRRGTWVWGMQRWNPRPPLAAPDRGPGRAAGVKSVLSLVLP